MPPGRAAAASAKAIDTLMSAILGRRRVRMRYHSFSSQQVKDYIVEPYRLAYAQGGLYLQAFVPDYSEMRTFADAAHRTGRGARGDLQPGRERGPTCFPHSLGAFSGTPETVVIEFSADEAPYVREREWHASQTIDELPGGRIRLTLNVVIDWELQAWVMGFGPAARVITPEAFAQANCREPRRDARDLPENRIGIDRRSPATTSSRRSS